MSLKIKIQVSNMRSQALIVIDKIPNLHAFIPSVQYEGICRPKIKP
jgi:hypothetical protein